jgi:PAS domain S-box-containing protein
MLDWWKALLAQRRVTGLVLGGVATAFGCAFVIAITVIYTIQDYRETLARGEARATLLTNVLSAHAIDALRDAETGMRMAGKIATLSPDSAITVRDLIALQQRHMPSITSMYVIAGPEDAVGIGEPDTRTQLREWSGPTATEPSTGFLVGDLQARSDGRGHFIPLRLGIAASGREPARVVLASLSPDFLVHLHKSASYEQDVISLLVGRDDRVIARAPEIVGAIGRDISKAPLFSQSSIGAAKQGILYGVSPADGVDRVVGFTLLPEFGLRAYSGFDRDLALAPWWERFKRNVLLGGLLLFLVAISAFFAIRRARHAKEVRHELALSERRHRIALASLHEGLVMQDAQGRLISWNPAALQILGLTDDQIAGRTSMDPRWRSVREDGSDLPGDQHPSMISLATQRSQVGTVLGIHDPGGSLRWLRVNAAPIIDERSEARVVSSFVDITEERARAHEVAELNRTLEARVAERTEELRDTSGKLEELVKTLEHRALEQQRMIYILSHDLREPLNAVINFSHVLNRSEAPRLSEAGKQYLEFIGGSASRMKLLLDDLLKYVRLEDGETNFQRIDFSVLLDEVKLDLTAAIERTQATIICDAPIAMDGDNSLMRILMQNLVSNAVKFVPKDRKPVVHITGRIAEGRCLIRVQDNGIGIAADHQPRVFDLFKRLNRRDAFEGTGLGLAICRRVVEIHGGTISLTSTPDVGTCFHIDLPVTHISRSSKGGL